MIRGSQSSSEGFKWKFEKNLDFDHEHFLPIRITYAKFGKQQFSTFLNRYLLLLRILFMIEISTPLLKSFYRAFVSLIAWPDREGSKL